MFPEHLLHLKTILRIPEDHTRRYVVRHTQDKNYSVHHTHTYDSNEQHITETPPQPIRNTERCIRDPDISLGSVDIYTNGKDIYSTPLNPQAPIYVLPVEQSSTVYATEFSRFLLKKELLFSRLTHFDDRPTSYEIWKCGFLGITKELQVTTVEELDLLVKWLGPESSKHARSLRAANAQEPARGLERVWQRLDERYGCPEMVESALKNKLSDFPKLTNKDNKKLYELSDLLSEIESVKNQEKYKALLGYLDSSSGVRPIIAKLPYGLQEKWTSHAVKYKQSHQVIFPPFSVLVDFIVETSRIKNDPSFVYDSALTTKDLSKPLTQNILPKSSFVSARKTEIPKHSMDKFSKCLVHGTNHPLTQCKVFKAKPREEKLKLLKEHGMCFRCCDSNSHMATTCNEKIKCEECGSTRHISAMHIDGYIPKHIQDSKPNRNIGGEGETFNKELQNSSITSKCTQVCGKTFNGKSCAKIILVKVYPNGKPEQAIRTYAR